MSSNTHGTRNIKHQRSRPGWVSALIVFGTVVWFGLFAIVMFCQLETAPARSIVGPPPADLRGETVEIASALCPYPLAGWYFNGEPGRGAVLLLHGYRANRKSQINRIKILRAAGFSILAIDFRAHGESFGKSVTLGKDESRDVIAAAAWLKALLPSERIGIIGTSMGGAAAILAGPNIDAGAMVLEQVYADIETAVANRFAMRLGEWSRALAPPLLRVAAFASPIDVAALDLVAAIPKVKAPLLIVSSEKDLHARPQESVRLFQAATGEKELFNVAHVAHADLATAAPDAYKSKIIPFLSRHLSARDPAPSPAD